MTRISTNLRTGRFALLIVGAFLIAGCAPAADMDVSGSGGQSASGGATGSGGSSTGSGGAVNSSGGATASGGAVGSGGARTGGANGTGGSASGGATATGGRVGTGGTSTGTGGARTGGSTGSGGAAGGSSGGGFAAVASLLATSCATGTCHQATDHLDLRNNAGLYARLVGVKPTGTKVMTGCGTVVVAGSPSTSLLSKAVKASVSGCTNARMPDECSTSSSNPRACLTTTQIAVIDAWITANAPM